MCRKARDPVKQNKVKPSTSHHNICQFAPSEGQYDSMAISVQLVVRVPLPGTDNAQPCHPCSDQKEHCSLALSSFWKTWESIL
ncbi:Kinesin-like protein KIF16B [Dissostichus eleginoides]|uniref:Kinesin-like protein KIF16B n=1 Tax=Dissostichus eleginoides TaxID=100907 RepID=A0AAD9FB10_DISEL|nr:Kinesin-like protein KIF16B [Dissostichus eleginoides]